MKVEWLREGRYQGVDRKAGDTDDINAEVAARLMDHGFVKEQEEKPVSMSKVAPQKTTRTTGPSKTR